MYHEGDKPASEKQENFFSYLPPKQSFIAGFVSGVMLLCTIGFVVLMVFFFRGDSAGAFFKNSKNNNAAANTNVNAAANNNPTDTAPTVGDLKAVDSKTDHVRGDLNKAKVVLVEYSDFECPYCKRFDATMQQLVKDYGDKIAWVYRHFPLSFHANAEKEAEASECAAEIGGNTAFWKYADKIYERTTSNGTGFALDQLVPLAKEIGLNETKFKTCLDSGKYAQEISAEESDAQKAGVTGTPGTIVIGKDGTKQMIEGAQDISVLKQVIDSMMK